VSHPIPWDEEGPHQPEDDDSGEVEFGQTTEKEPDEQQPGN
jgi:hypothetical protein